MRSQAHRQLTAGTAGGPPHGPPPRRGRSGPHGSRAEGLSPHPWGPGSQRPDQLDQRRNAVASGTDVSPSCPGQGEPEGSSSEV